MINNTEKNSEITVGYSALRIFDDCYEYNENACYVAGTSDSLKEFLLNAMLPVNDYEITPVLVSDLINDFGCSSGEYALELEALSRFEKVAEAFNIAYTVTPYEDSLGQQPNLFIVDINTSKQEIPESSAIRKLFETLKDLERYDSTYKHEAVDAAIGLKDEITPALIDVLEKIIISPDEYASRENYFGHIYAVMLLGHFREVRSHTAIVDLFSLPENILEGLFGDLVFEDLPPILLRTCGGSFDEIESLALNNAAWDRSRYAALKSMVLGVLEGVLDRDETLAFFSSLFTGEEADYPSDFWNYLAKCVYDLYPEELMESIKKAYAEDLIDSGMIGIQDFEFALEQKKEEFIEERRLEEQHKSMDDIHGRMSWWASFDQEMDVPRISSSPNPKRKVKFQKKKKSRKKMKKASKKKNRR